MGDMLLRFHLTQSRVTYPIFVPKTPLSEPLKAVSSTPLHRQRFPSLTHPSRVILSEVAQPRVEGPAFARLCPRRCHCLGLSRAT